MTTDSAGKTIRLPEVLPIVWQLLRLSKEQRAKDPFLKNECCSWASADLVQAIIMLRTLHRFMIEGSLLNAELNQLGNSVTSMIRSSSTWLTSRNVQELITFADTSFGNAHTMNFAATDTQAEGLLVLQRILVSILVIQIVVSNNPEDGTEPADPGMGLSDLGFSWVPEDCDRSSAQEDNRVKTWEEFRNAYEFLATQPFGKERADCENLKSMREWKKDCLEAKNKMLRSLRNVPRSARPWMSFKRDDIAIHLRTMRSLMGRIRQDFIAGDINFEHEKAWGESVSVLDEDRQRRHRFTTLHTLMEQTLRLSLSKIENPQIMDSAVHKHTSLLDSSADVGIAPASEPRMWDRSSNLYERANGLRAAIKAVGLWDLYAPVLQAVKVAKERAVNDGLSADQWEDVCDPHILMIYRDMISKFTARYGIPPEGLEEEADETSTLTLLSQPAAPTPALAPTPPPAPAPAPSAPPAMISAPTPVGSAMRASQPVVGAMADLLEKGDPLGKGPPSVDESESEAAGHKRAAESDAASAASGSARSESVATGESDQRKKVPGLRNVPVAKKPKEAKEERVGYPEMLASSFTPPPVKDMQFSVTLERPYRVVPEEWLQKANHNDGVLYEHFHFEDLEEVRKHFHDHLFFVPEGWNMDSYPAGCAWPGKDRSTWSYAASGHRNIHEKEKYSIPPESLQSALGSINSDLFEFETDWYKWRSTIRAVDETNTCPDGITMNGTFSIPRDKSAPGVDSFPTERQGWDPQKHVVSVGFDIDDVNAEPGARRKVMKWSRSYADHPNRKNEDGSPVQIPGWSINTQGLWADKWNPDCGKPRAISVFVEDKLIFAGCGGWDKTTINRISEAEKGFHQGKNKVEMAARARLGRTRDAKGKGNVIGDKGKGSPGGGADASAAANTAPASDAPATLPTGPPPDTSSATPVISQETMFQEFQAFQRFQAAMAASAKAPPGKGDQSAPPTDYWGKDTWGAWNPAWHKGKGDGKGDPYGPYGSYGSKKW